MPATPIRTLAELHAAFGVTPEGTDMPRTRIPAAEVYPVEPDGITPIVVTPDQWAEIVNEPPSYDEPEENLAEEPWSLDTEVIDPVDVPQPEPEEGELRMMVVGNGRMHHPTDEQVEALVAEEPSLAQSYRNAVATSPMSVPQRTRIPLSSVLNESILVRSSLNAVADFIVDGGAVTNPAVTAAFNRLAGHALDAQVSPGPVEGVTNLWPALDRLVSISASLAGNLHALHRLLNHLGNGADSIPNDHWRAVFEHDDASEGVRRILDLIEVRGAGPAIRLNLDAPSSARDRAFVDGLLTPNATGILDEADGWSPAVSPNAVAAELHPAVAYALAGEQQEPDDDPEESTTERITSMTQGALVLVRRKLAEARAEREALANRIRGYVAEEQRLSRAVRVLTTTRGMTEIAEEGD